MIIHLVNGYQSNREKLITMMKREDETREKKRALARRNAAIESEILRMKDSIKEVRDKKTSAVDKYRNGEDSEELADEIMVMSLEMDRLSEKVKSLRIDLKAIKSDYQALDPGKNHTLDEADTVTASASA